MDDFNPDPVLDPALDPLPDDGAPPIITVGSFSRPFRVANKIVRFVQEEGRWPRVLVCGHVSINQAVKGLAGARRTLLQQDVPMELGFFPRFRSDDHFRPLLALDTVMLPLQDPEADAAPAGGQPLVPADPQQQQQQQEEDEVAQQPEARQQQDEQQHTAQRDDEQPDPPQHLEGGLPDPEAASTSQHGAAPPQQQGQDPMPPQHQHSAGSGSSGGSDVVGTQASPTSPLVIRVAAVGRHARAGGAAAARIREGANVHLMAVGVGAVGTAVMAAAHAAFYLHETDARNLVVRPDVVRVVEDGQDLDVVKLMLSTLD